MIGARVEVRTSTRVGKGRVVGHVQLRGGKGHEAEVIMVRVARWREGRSGSAAPRSSRRLLSPAELREIIRKATKLTLLAERGRR